MLVFVISQIVLKRKKITKKFQHWKRIFHRCESHLWPFSAKIVWQMRLKISPPSKTARILSTITMKVKIRLPASPRTLITMITINIKIPSRPSKELFFVFYEQILEISSWRVALIDWNSKVCYRLVVNSLII